MPLGIPELELPYLRLDEQDRRQVIEHLCNVLDADREMNRVFAVRLKGEEMLAFEVVGRRSIQALAHQCQGQ
ncbi:hypothetical protein [Pseudomonas sp. S2_B07]